MTADRPADADDLRRHAEARLRSEAPDAAVPTSGADTMRLLHDLRVHQIELEIQNEELRRTQVALDASRARYFDLYDLAPVGYCALSETGRVLEGNLTAATLLGVGRNALDGRRLSQWVAPADRADYRRFLRAHFERGQRQQIEVRLVRADGATLWGRLVATPAPPAGAEATCRLVIIDIDAERRATDGLEAASSALHGRVRELTCLSGIRAAAAHMEQPLHEVFQTCVGLLPPAFRHRELACARIRYRDREFRTPGFVETPWMLSEPLPLRGGAAGRVDVCLLREAVDAEGRVFLDEERELLGAVAQILAGAGERRLAEELRQRTDRRNRALLQVLQVDRISRDAAAALAIRALGELTGSAIGFVGFVDPATRSVTAYPWARGVDGAGAHPPLQLDLDDGALWAVVAREGRAAADNDGGAGPRRVTLPLGAEACARLLAVPVVRDGQVVLIAALGDKATDYDEEDIAEVTLYLEGAWALLGALRDQEARIESERRFRTLFESSPDAIMTTAPPTWRFTSGNPAALAMFRAVDEAEFTSAAPWQLSPPTQPDGRRSEEKAREMLEVALQSGSHGFEWMHRRLDGEDFPATVLLSRCVLGNTVVLQATVRDETVRRRLEEQLRSAHKIEAIGRLAGGVAHDFNNMLAVILAYSEFAMRAVPAEGRAALDLHEVKKAARRAAALTQQLLAFGRKQNLQPVAVNLNSIIVALASMLQRILGEDIQVLLQLSPHLAMVRVDPGQFEQVIMNLAVNARDAMPDGGTLSIETSNIGSDDSAHAHDANAAEATAVRLVVRDTGAGMDAAIRAQVFDPFFTTKPLGKGTGLGLSTVYGTVKQSGGEIRVESEPGQGAAFTITLPREVGATDTADHPTPLAVTARATAAETILVVEDEAALREILRRSLEAAGYTVLTASHGLEALELAAGHPGSIQLLLTDVTMPRMGGHALAERLGAARPTLKVVFMSGFTADTIDPQGARPAGAFFIGKPFSIAELTNRVREALDAT